MTNSSILSTIRRHPKRLQKNALIEIERDPSGFLHFLLDLSLDSDVEFLTDYILRCMQLDRPNQMQCAAQLEKHGAMHMLRQFADRRPAEAFSPDYVDLWYLYEYVRTSQPKEILEFGSGYSTVVMGAALLHNGTGQLYSLEAEKKWANATQASLPEAVRSICQVEYSPTGDCTIVGRQSKHFVAIPTESPDMIYIDGAPKDAVWMGAETVGLMEHSLRPGTTIFIDSRIKAVLFFLNKISQRKYHIEANVVALSNRTTKKRLAGRFGLDQFDNTCVTLID